MDMSIEAAWVCGDIVSDMIASGVMGAFLGSLAVLAYWTKRRSEPPFDIARGLLNLAS